MALRLRVGVGLAVVAVVVLAFALPALAAKGLSDFIGVQGSTGAAPGQFDDQAGLDVNDPDPGGANENDSVDPYGDSTDGYVYVADEDNHRIQVFDSDQQFVFSFGGEVNATATANVCPRPGFPGDDCAKAGNDATSDAGYLDDPQGVAIDQVDGSVYVTDQDNFRIQKFTAAGEFVYMLGNSVNQTAAAANICPRPGFPADVCEVGASGSGDGQFGSTMEGHPAVDPNTQELWVPDAGGTANRRMQKFASDGTFLLKFGGNGSGVGLFGSGAPNHAAVDDAGRVYVLDDSQDQIERFAADGTGGEIFAAAELSGSPEPGRIAIDHNGPGSTDDRIYVVKEVGGESVVKELDEDGNLLDTHGTGADLDVSNSAGGLAVNPDTGSVYFSTDSSGHEGVYVLNDIAGPLQATIDPVTEVTASTASLNATINPNGSRTHFRFEISEDGINYSPIPATDEDAGLGTSAQQYSFPATDLKANTFYRVRLVATRVDGDEIVTGNINFLTAEAPPTVTSVAASQISDTTAQLNGIINPGGVPTTYWFEWGDDLYGNQVPVPAGSAGSAGAATAIGESLTGLASDTTYHFRLCAQNVHAASPVCGADRTFTTRLSAASPEGRSYEMVTDPDKVLRGGFAGVGPAGQPDYARAQTPVPSPDGESLMWGLFPGATSSDAGHGFTWAETYELYGRGAMRWNAEAVTNVAPIPGGSNAVLDRAGISADLKTSAWYTQTPMFDNFPTSGIGSNQAIRVMGDDGGPRAAGWYPWLDPSWYSGSIAANRWGALIDDSGQRLIGWARAQTNESLIEMAPADGGGSPASLGQQSGRSLVLSDPSYGWRPGDLINECTGNAGEGNQTLILSRVGTGVATDAIAAQDCEAGSPTNAHGALLGGTGHLQASSITAMSDSGERVFFISPDLLQGGSTGVHDSAELCEIGTGAATRCPPQLFVRQYGNDGEPTVRWISRAEDDLFDAPQQIGLLGNGVAFEGASRDGSVVYFRTNAPLTADDPNGGALGDRPVTEGTASWDSWDLYRYELGDDNDADPAAGDPADRLTRVSGGPDGDADPNTNCRLIATTGDHAGGCAGQDDSSVPNGEGGVVRFMSDDGDRVYFVTAAQIPGATNAPPAGGATTPTGAGEQVNASSRNIYLYDASKSGAAAYEFVARIPFVAFSLGQFDIGSCASFSSLNSGPAFTVSSGDGQFGRLADLSCVHGTGSGDAIVFETTGRLTADDVDDASDVYVYEAAADRLTRISAPPPGAAPYGCMRANRTAAPAVRCNADLGVKQVRTTVTGAGGEVGLVGSRHWNMAENPDGTLRAVYFESRLPLTEDKGTAPGSLTETYGEGHMAVYEWRDGRLSLISPAASQDSAFYTGNSRDGKHVFFWTEQRISPWEIDAADGDAYNATTAPPLPGPPPPPPLCGVLAGSCHGADAAAAPVAAATSSTTANGNAPAVQRKTLRVAAVGARARARAARTGRLAVRVRTSGAGRLSAVARVRIGRSRGVVGRASKRVARPGVTTVRLRLNAAARRVLRIRRTLNLAVQVRQAGARPRTITVRLRRAGS